MNTLPCKHKQVITASNFLVQAAHCRKLGIFVDNKICQGCSAREGESPADLVSIAMPRRSDEAIQEIEKVCEGCPFFNQDFRTCKQDKSNSFPVTTLAQNPKLRCPMQKW